MNKVISSSSEEKRQIGLSKLQENKKRLFVVAETIIVAISQQKKTTFVTARF